MTRTILGLEFRGEGNGVFDGMPTLQHTAMTSSSLDAHPRTRVGFISAAGRLIPENYLEISSRKILCSRYEQSSTMILGSVSWDPSVGGSMSNSHRSMHMLGQNLPSKNDE